MLWHRDERLGYSAADAPIGLVGRTRILHMTPHDTAACIAMASAAREAGLPEIFIPRAIVPVAKVPILGTGKIDYVSAGKMAAELAAAS